MLEIKNLNVTVEEKQILKNLNLNIGKGEVHAIMGPNGSGKSTIAHTLAGKPNYNVKSGEVNLNGEDLLSKDPYERSLNGLFLAFQYPIELPGVTNASYLKQIVNAHRKSRKETPIDAGEFLKILKEKSKLRKSTFVKIASTAGFIALPNVFLIAPSTSAPDNIPVSPPATLIPKTSAMESLTAAPVPAAFNDDTNWSMLDTPAKSGATIPAKPKSLDL